MSLFLNFCCIITINGVSTAKISFECSLSLRRRFKKLSQLLFSFYAHSTLFMQPVMSFPCFSLRRLFGLRLTTTTTTTAFQFPFYVYVDFIRASLSIEIAFHSKCSKNVINASLNVSMEYFIVVNEIFQMARH